MREPQLFLRDAIAGRQVTVAHHEAMTLLVEDVLAVLDVGIDFGLKCHREHALCSQAPACINTSLAVVARKAKLVVAPVMWCILAPSSKPFGVRLKTSHQGYAAQVPRTPSTPSRHSFVCNRRPAEIYAGPTRALLRAKAMEKRVGPFRGPLELPRVPFMRDKRRDSSSACAIAAPY